MAYCTQTDIEKLIPVLELAEITTEIGDAPDTSVVEYCIAKADAEIDSYCSKQYSVPFSPVPARITALSVDIAIYHLYSRRSVAPDIRRIKYEDALTFLKDLAKGIASVGTTNDPPLATSGTNDVFIESNDRVFRRSAMA